MEPLTDDELDTLANSTLIGASPDLPARSVVELLSLRQQLVDVTAERDRLRQFARRQAEEIESLNDMADAVEVLRDIGKVIGCGHVDGPDERRQLVNCIEQEFTRVTAERDRLRAELLQQPPTLEWLRATFGGQPEVAAGSTGYNVYRWSCGVKYRDPHGQVSCPPGVLKRTRAAVLEAVAETKIESEVK